ncbi:DUF983 domain-containing protein [Cellulosimicrobium funkei]|uniref:DUF983 domain-containing protein n=1 Tax=Cellulosimicrobium funkei TaxID=264251 RepID=UPI0037DCD9D5
MSDYSLGLAQDRDDERVCERCGDIVDYLSSRGYCDGCEEELEHEPTDGAPTPAGVAVVLATVVALFVAGVLVAWQASPFDGAHLILAPGLIIAAAALATRFVWVQHHRGEVRRG